MSTVHYKCDSLVVGAGIFGLYAAQILLKAGHHVVIIDSDQGPFARASKINQARVHFGYHYPRSMATAMQSIDFAEKFISKFQPAINSSFHKIYAISERNSIVSADHFKKFCKFLKIDVREINGAKYFRPGATESCFLTSEPSFDWKLISDQLMKELEGLPNVTFLWKDSPLKLNPQGLLSTKQGATIETKNVVNCSYAGLNQILQIFDQKPLDLKYELTEVVLGRVSEPFQDIGITLMDGPFFSAMPFGKSGLHSLTAVDFTPHASSTSALPRFSCQTPLVNCAPELLANCNTCKNQPVSAFPEMRQLAKRYLADSFDFTFQESLFTIKTILRKTEVDDARPTLVDSRKTRPALLNIFSGKITTIFEIEAGLKEHLL